MSLNNKKAPLSQNHPLILKYIKCIQDFCIFKSKSLDNKTASTDSLIDYSNYLYQTHYRVTSCFKLIENLKKVQDEKIIHKINEKLVEYVYNILTDTLAINNLTSEDDLEDDCDSNKKIANNGSKSIEHWNELFLNACQDIKSNYIIKNK
jgi:hypothetical protein